jgi:hypothetical protein
VTARRTLHALLLVALVATTAPAWAEWEEVAVRVPLPPEIDVSAGERVLVALVRSNDHPRFSPGLEITRWMRREIAQKTALDVIGGPPPPIPEQRPEALAVNDLFWRQLGEDFDADLIIAGVATYLIEDRSGFVSQDRIDPRTGQTVRRSVFEERNGYQLRIQVFFIKGDNGALLHSDTWTEERIIAETTAQEDLQVLFLLLETMEDDLRAVLLPTEIREPRFVWVD